MLFIKLIIYSYTLIHNIGLVVTRSNIIHPLLIFQIPLCGYF
jgi:hypothetical protein